MNTSNHISVVLTRDGDTCAWIALDERSGTWSAETMVRVPGGIRYRDRDYGGDCPTIDRLRTDALTGGFLSPRPLLPGVAVDPSMADCALALFVHLCVSRGTTDPCALIEQDRSRKSCGVADLARIIAQAEWEGIVYPARWDALWVDMLANALYATCYDSLGDLVLITMHRQRT